MCFVIRIFNENESLGKFVIFYTKSKGNKN